MRIEDCKQIADEISERETEIAYRSSINRYYYFLVLTLVSIAEQRSVDLPEDHKIHDKLGELLSSICPNMIDDFESLREMRGDSDYELDSIDKSEHIEAKRKTEDLFDTLEDKTTLPRTYFAD